MASRTNVPAATVRAWAEDNVALLGDGPHAFLNEGARGRLPQYAVDAFRKANKGKAYAPGAAEARTVTFKVPATDKAGRNISRKVTLTTTEARAVLGSDAPVKGRLPMDRVRAAYIAAQ